MTFPLYAKQIRSDMGLNPTEFPSQNKNRRYLTRKKRGGRVHRKEAEKSLQGKKYSFPSNFNEKNTTVRCLQGEPVNVCHCENLVVGQARRMPRVRGCRQIPEGMCMVGPARTISLVSVLRAYRVMQSAGEWLRQDAVWHNTAVA